MAENMSAAAVASANDDLRRRVARLYLTGLSIEKVGHAVGISKDAARAALVDRGVAIRRVGQRKRADPSAAGHGLETDRAREAGIREASAELARRVNALRARMAA